VYWTSEKMYCLEFNTGKLKWEGGSFGSPGSCIVAADGKLIAWGERGKLVFVEPADRYKELTRRVRLSQALSWPHVVLADGRVFCKDRDGVLTCFLLKPSH
jgi:outer membrane protein assembly factor BamB